MAILTGPEIEEVVRRTRTMRAAGQSPPLPSIDVDPWVPGHVGPNSLDVTLGDTLVVYDLHQCDETYYSLGSLTLPVGVLDARADNPTRTVAVPPEGFVLHPGTLYLGSTVERVECHGVVPWVDGRSSVGRLGLSVHVTAGRGDDGWSGALTLELTVVHHLRVYPGMRVGQLTFMTTVGGRRPYAGRYQHSAGPVASRFHLGDGRAGA